jgi:hypothetical protein
VQGRRVGDGHARHVLEHARGERARQLRQLVRLLPHAHPRREDGHVARVLGPDRQVPRAVSTRCRTPRARS